MVPGQTHIGSPDAVPPYVDSTTYPTRLTPPGSNPDFFNAEELINDPERIGVLLTKSIHEAHMRTCLFSTEQIKLQWQKGVDQNQVYGFKNMTQETIWVTAAEALTHIIKQIIEFAKMVPGFMRFNQDDQIVLLKKGAFELAIIRMSRYFDTSQNAVLFMNHMLPMGAFMENRDTTEMKLVSQIFDFAKSLAEMELTDVALSLFSAYILLQEDRQNLKNIEEVRRLNQAVARALDSELRKFPPKVPVKGDVSVLSKLLNKRGALREISYLHTEALARFWSSLSTQIEFPALHRELFPT